MGTLRVSMPVQQDAISHHQVAAGDRRGARPHTGIASCSWARLVGHPGVSASYLHSNIEPSPPNPTLPGAHLPQKENMFRVTLPRFLPCWDNPTRPQAWPDSSRLSPSEVTSTPWTLLSTRASCSPGPISHYPDSQAQEVPYPCPSGMLRHVEQSRDSQPKRKA